MSHEEEDTCMSYEEEDTCLSNVGRRVYVLVVELIQSERSVTLKAPQGMSAALGAVVVQTKYGR
jgi:hypothetical protein